MSPDPDHSVKNAVIFSQHTWKGLREAGFHAIGRSLLSSGFDVCFATQPITLSFVLGRIAEGGLSASRELKRGIRYQENAATLTNFSEIDLTLPGPLRNLAPNFFRLSAERKLVARAAKQFPTASVLVIESSRLVHHWAYIKQRFPNAPLVYRPSDPIYARDDRPESLKQNERDLVATADLVLCVNQQAKEYFAALPGVSASKIAVLPNGIHLDGFQNRTPPTPNREPTFAYIGASAPNWTVIFNACRRYPEFRFKVICPVRPSNTLMREIQYLTNLTFIPGIPPEEVPEQVLSSDVIMAVYPENCKNWARGGHAKLYQAIAARKPTIGLNAGQGSTPFLSIDCQSADEFCDKLPQAINSDPPSLTLIDGLTWKKFEEVFAHHIEQLLSNSSLKNDSEQ